MSDHGHDDWHQHTTAEGAPQDEHGSTASAKAMGMTFLIMVFGVAIVIVLLIWYFNSYVSSFKAERQEGVAVIGEPAFQAKVAAANRLDSMGWIDREARTVHIPVDDAAAAVIADYNASASAEPIADDQG